MSPHARTLSLRAVVALVLLSALVLIGIVPAPRAEAQPSTRICDGFSRTRAGNILEGICYARSGYVAGTRAQVNDVCEQLIRLGSENDLGDVHLARNVCKGAVDPRCDHGEFDVYGGPFVKNATCRAVQRRCAEVQNDDRRMCDEVSALLRAGTDAGLRVMHAGDAASAGMVRFRFPVEDAALIESAWTGEPWNFMKGPFLVDHDHNSRGLACRDYMNRGAGGPLGMPFCYGGHTGSDFILRGGFSQMDVPNANWIVAAADGVVESVVDTLFDRCHAELITGDMRFFNVDCNGRIDGGPSKSNFPANTIVVRHADGTRTMYLHLRTRSAIVRSGQTVTCGQRLARIGSSGISSMPHLHFEVHDAAGQVVDPFAGPASQAESRWVDQGPDYRRIPASRCAAR